MLCLCLAKPQSRKGAAKERYILLFNIFALKELRFFGISQSRKKAAKDLLFFYALRRCSKTNGERLFTILKIPSLISASLQSGKVDLLNRVASAC